MFTPLFIKTEILKLYIYYLVSFPLQIWVLASHLLLICIVLFCRFFSYSRYFYESRLLFGLT